VALRLAFGRWFLVTTGGNAALVSHKSVTTALRLRVVAVIVLGTLGSILARSSPMETWCLFFAVSSSSESVPKMLYVEWEAASPATAASVGAGVAIVLAVALAAANAAAMASADTGGAATTTMGANTGGAATGANVPKIGYSHRDCCRTTRVVHKVLRHGWRL
jgi:hypothetical protein